jgi:predicted PurR-regulated permease PerM
MPNTARPTSDARTVRINPGGASTSPEMLIVAAIAIAALYFGREVLIPLALAVLLSFALGPPVLLLRRWHVNRVLAVVAVVALAFAVIFSVGAVIGSQLAHLADNLPQYQTNMTEKIHSLRQTTASNGVVARAGKALSDLGNEITKAPEAGGNTAASGPAGLTAGVQQQEPVPVEVRQSDPTQIDLIVRVVAPLFQPLVTAGIVVVFVIFFLLQRQDLRDRFIRLAGARDLGRTTQALDEAGRRLSHYLLRQAAVNATVGILIGIGLWIIDVPNPVLWGILTMLLRFVPYIGPIIAAAFPAALAFAVDPGWWMLVFVVGLYLVVEGITGQIIEPWLYGRSTGLSSVAVIVAAAFWTLLWGPVGLLLSTPLTMCLVVLGRHVEHLKFLEVLLGDQPALAPEETFYQRMLADDPDEAAHQAEAFLKEAALGAYYDEVAIKGLALAQLDVNRGALDHARRVRVKEAVEWVIDDLSEHEDASVPVLENDATDVTPVAVLSKEELAPSWRGKALLCVAGRGSLDEAAAAMLVQLVERRGIGARVVPSESVSAAMLSQLDLTDVRIVCLSYLEPGSFANPRFLIRRLRRRLPHATIVDGFWTLTPDEVEARNARTATGADHVATSLQQAAQLIVNAAMEAARLELERETIAPAPEGATVPDMQGDDEPDTATPIDRSKKTPSVSPRLT